MSAVPNPQPSPEPTPDSGDVAEATELTAHPTGPSSRTGSGFGARDAAYWAKQVTRLQLGEVPPEAVNLNVTGKRVVGPIQGFGKLWQKTYRVELPDIDATPAEVVATWKRQFGSFWPPTGRFYGPLTGIAPGEVALLNLSPGGGMRLSTGILVLYADDEAFTFMTPEGHMFAAWITFSAVRGADSVVAALAQVLLRANDPLYELAMAFGGHRAEDRFWRQTLTNLADHLGVAEPVATTTVLCVDRRRQWRKAGNIWHNAAIRSTLHTLGTPLRSLRSRLGQRTRDPSQPGERKDGGASSPSMAQRPMDGPGARD